jgi:hypothetical protein
MEQRFRFFRLIKEFLANSSSKAIFPGMKSLSIRQLASASQIIACLGIIPAVWGIFHASDEARREEQKTQELLRLTAFPALDGIIQRDRAELENIDEATWDLRNMAKNNQLRSTYSTGKSAYYGTKGLASAGRHYEYLGVMVRLRYVEFEPIFEVISFPDSLWDAAVDSGLLKMVREENWNGTEKPLPDFWVNFEYLRNCYQAARKGEPIPGQQDRNDQPGLLDRIKRIVR